MLRNLIRRKFCVKDHPLFKKEPAINVLGGELKPCCFEPVTGFYRDGFCNTGNLDAGRHLVCAQITEEFLEFSKSAGNDLSTPVPGMFPGLKEGDKWCICVLRWKEAFDAGMAPLVYLECTHQKALEFVDAQDLMQYAVDIKGDMSE